MYFKLANLTVWYFNAKRRPTGHILGSAASRSKEQVQERSLSPTNCSIMRVFLHAILTWSSSFIDTVSIVIQSCMNTSSATNITLLMCVKNCEKINEMLVLEFTMHSLGILHH